ncbi:MAG: 16S rRNA (uracil(1498)-N(3))-methyltransferase [Gammaproteobacteria bacterium]|nr:16S rRNA (uracil(1498)-N(3))-methyltransferase [Gammaproteobacteria bacterium]MDH5594800.1 16S rRNA (uracil(1498)-N(3))-methyltransferase [Gammaproteobacteria bacterium]
MRIPRLYLHQTINSGDTITLDDNTANHSVRVLRLKENAPVILFNGEGGEFEATIETIKKEVTVKVGRFIDINRESPLRIHLVQGISRGERMDYTIQKAVELGITEITPVITDRCVVKLTAERAQKRLDHWQGVMISACEQSGRTQIPQLNPIQKLDDWMDQPRRIPGLVLYHKANKTLSDITRPEGDITLLIGPEGGLDEAEIKHAVNKGFTEIQLGPRVLRTETAALTVLSAIQTMWGDLG